MINPVPEQEFLCRDNTPINYIGIYDLYWIIDDNQLDCEGVIVAFEDKQYLIKSQEGKDDDFEYYEFTGAYKCRKIVSSPTEPISFICKEKEGTCRILRFQIGIRPILVTLLEDGSVTIGISHWNTNGEWLEFENNHLLNDN